MDRPALLIRDVHSAETLLDVGDQRVDGVQVGQVAGDRYRVAAAFGDAADQLVEQILAAGHRDHGGAVAGELFGGAFADAGRGPGEQDSLAGQVDLGGARPGQQAWRQRRTHGGQHDLLGQSAQRVLTHRSGV